MQEGGAASILYLAPDLSFPSVLNQSSYHLYSPLSLSPKNNPCLGSIPNRISGL